jgi:peptide/nickel transport system permease protein
MQPPRDMTPSTDLSSPTSAHRSLTSDVLARLRRDTAAVASLAIILLLVFFAVAAPLVAPFDPIKMNPPESFLGPNFPHLMGTDELGRDLLSRIIYGSRTSLSVGIISVSISLLIGAALGLVAGTYLGVTDLLVSRVMDILYAFPALLLALVVIAILGTGIDRVMVAVGIVYIPLFFRICRGSALVERSKVYVDAARMVGASSLRIMWRHILPNVLAPLIVQATLAMSYAILAEAALSYLGLGAQPPTPSWGYMLSKGRAGMSRSLWVSIWPGLAIMVVVYAFNVLGDGLRDALDPRLRGT